MGVFIFLNFLFICFVSVFLYIHLKDSEYEIEELYKIIYSNMPVYNISKKDEIKENKKLIKSKVVNFDKFSF